MTPAARTSVVLWLAAMLAGAAIVWNSRFSADMSFFLPARPSPEQQLLVDQLRESALSRVLLLAISGGDARARAALSSDFSERLARLPEFAAVRNGETKSLAADHDFLFRHRYLLSPTVTPQRFSVDGLQAAIAESVELLVSPAGPLVKRLLPQDPTGELLALLAGLDAGAQPNSRAGVWASRDGERALLVAQTTALGSDVAGQAAAIAALQDAFAAAASESSAARLQLAGPAVFAVHARATIKEEVTRLSLISTLAIVCLLAFVYRSLRLTVLGLLPVASGALAGVVAVSLAYGTVFGITVGFGSALIGEAVDYSIYYLVQSEGRAGVDWRERCWPTIRLGVLTSLCGFGVLVFSGFPGLAQLGLYASSGLLAAAIVTRFVLPQLAAARREMRDLTPLGMACARWAQRLACRRWPWWLLAGLAAATLLAARDELWSRDLASLSTVSAEDLATDALLRAELGTPDSRLLVCVSGADQEQALQAAERTGVELERLVASGVIGAFDSPARFLPSAATQLARRASLPSGAELRARLPHALRASPLAAHKLDPFLRDIDAARTAPLIDRQALQGTSLGLAVDALLVPHGSGWSVLLPVRPAAGQQAIDVGALRAGVAASGARVIDMKAELDALYAAYLSEAQLLALAGFVAIVVLLAVSLRSARRVLRVIVPLLLAVLLVSAGLHLAGVRLQLLHLVGLLLIVAVGSNYALFFERFAGRLSSEPRTVASMAVACLATAIGFGTLALAKVPVLQALGVTVGPGAILALLLAAAFSPPEP